MRQRICEFGQRGALIIMARYQMSAAEIEPAQLRRHRFKKRVQCIDRAGQRRKSLFAQCMDMQPPDHIRQFVLKLMQRRAQTRAGRAGVIFCHLPFRMHWIDAQAQLGIAAGNLLAETTRLLRGVNNDMGR